MNILAQVTPSIFDFKITLGNIITVVLVISGFAANYVRQKQKLEDLIKTDKGQENRLESLEKQTRDFDKLIATNQISFQEHKDTIDKQLTAHNNRFEKIEQIIPKIERISANIETILKWIDKKGG
jgi:hypothetical protein